MSGWYPDRLWFLRHASLAFALMVCLPPTLSLFLKKIYLLLLFLAVLGLCCCTWMFSSYGDQGLLFISVCELLIVLVFLVAEHRLFVCGLQ